MNDKKSFKAELFLAKDGRAVNFYTIEESFRHIRASDSNGESVGTVQDKGYAEAISKYMTVNSLSEAAQLTFIRSREDNIFTLNYLEDYVNLSPENYLYLYNDPSWKYEYQILNVNNEYLPLTHELMIESEYEVVIKDVYYKKTLYTYNEHTAGKNTWAYVAAENRDVKSACRFKLKIIQRGI